MKLTRNQLEGLVQDTALDSKGKNLYGKCPMCGENEFGISLDDNHPFSCFRKSKCGFVGNIYTLLKHLGKTREFLSERDINIFERLENKLAIVEEDSEEEQQPIFLPEVKIPILWKRVFDDPYLRERGFTDDQFQKFEVGRSILKKDYVTFMVRMNEVIVGYISRSTKSKEWIDAFNKRQKEQEYLKSQNLPHKKLVFLRYDNSASDFSKMLFGYDEIIAGVTTDVILVEGIFSKTKTDVNLGLDGFSDNSFKCVSTFGAKLSVDQIDLLKAKGVKRLWFWFEADVLNKIKPILANASLHFEVKASYLEGRDPNDIDTEGALELLESSRDWLNFNLSYVKGNLKINES